MGEPDHGFLNFILLDMCAPRIVALLLPMHFCLYNKF